jgi:predicted HicB family RNase H-like nuclease
MSTHAKKLIGVRLEESLAKRLRVHAARTNTSMSSIVEVAVTNHLKAGAA